MTPIFLWINNRSNNDTEEMDDLSEVNLMKLEIKKKLFNMLETWIQESNLNHEQIALKLAVNISVLSDIMHQHFDKFTVDRLIDLVIKTGMPVKLVITNKDK